jgi:hypothetical protein
MLKRAIDKGQAVAQGRVMSNAEARKKKTKNIPFFK